MCSCFGEIQKRIQALAALFLPGLSVTFSRFYGPGTVEIASLSLYLGCPHLEFFLIYADTNSWESIFRVSNIVGWVYICLAETLSSGKFPKSLVILFTRVSKRKIKNTWKMFLTKVKWFNLVLGNSSIFARTNAACINLLRAERFSLACQRYEVVMINPLLWMPLVLWLRPIVLRTKCEIGL